VLGLNVMNLSISSAYKVWKGMGNDGWGNKLGLYHTLVVGTLSDLYIGSGSHGHKNPNTIMQDAFRRASPRT
jgi:hypothetical protein